MEEVNQLIESLENNGMHALFVPSAGEATTTILNMIPEEATVGIGGSVTIRQLELPEVLAKRGTTVFEHWNPGLTPDERKKAARDAMKADYYLSSSNAVTIDGKLVNTDNTGNRVAALVFGPKHVIVVVGTNKIVSGVDAAIKRIKQRAAPLNCQRRQEDTPCAKGKECTDCNSPDRLCRVTSIIEKKTRGIESLWVLIVGQELGY